MNSNYSVKYDIAEFHKHPLQKIMALFLLKPELYGEYKRYGAGDRQGYFFARFRIFAAEYYNFVDDYANMYFTSLHKECAGSTNICGGAGKISHASKAYFKTKHNKDAAQRFKDIDTFSRKYRVNLELGEDERLFLGVREIWNNLARGVDIVMESEYRDVASRAYCDETFVEPIPDKLDKYLVPIAIRTRVTQKHANQKRAAYSNRPIVIKEREAEDEIVGVASSKEAPVMFVPPPEIDDSEW